MRRIILIGMVVSLFSALQAPVCAAQTSFFGLISRPHTFLYGTIAQEKAEAKDLTKFVTSKAKVMTEFCWSQGSAASENSFITYILKVPSDRAADFRAKGFQPVPKSVVLEITWERISQLRGSTKPQMTKNAKYRIELKESEYEDAFNMAVRTEKDFLKSLKDVSKEKCAEITSKKPVDEFEYGFQVNSEVKITCDPVVNGEKTILFEAYGRTKYFPHN